MLTISQLAASAGCTVKAVRIYHERGLLAEPRRDAVGYRRYDAQAVVDLNRIVTLVRAGVPLADVPALLAADAREHRDAVRRIDDDLAARIAELRERRRRLALLSTPDRLCLPDAVADHLDRLRALGLSERGVRMERDSWILTAALVDGVVETHLPLRAAMLDDAGYVQVLLALDEAVDWDPDDPRLDDLVEATAALAVRLSRPEDLEVWNRLPRQVLDVLTGFQGVDSPAWEALEQRVGARLAEGLAEGTG